MANEVQEKTRYFYNIDFLRFIFIMIVVYGHCIGSINAVCADTKFINILIKKSEMASTMAVCSFFMLGGYFLYNSFLKNPHPDTKLYALKRILRLWPLLLFSHLIILCAGMFTYADFLNIFFINNGLGLLLRASGNPASYFICVLLIISIFYYFVIKNTDEKWTAFICSISAFIGYAFMGLHYNLESYWVIVPGLNFCTWGMLIGFTNVSLGILIAILTKNLTDFNLKLKGKIFFTVLEVSLFSYIMYYSLMHKSKVTVLIFWVFLSVILLLLFIIKQGYFSKLLDCNFSKSLGACSYSIFITHYPIIKILKKILANGGNPYGGGGTAFT